jgi:hypothetical protein
MTEDRIVIDLSIIDDLADGDPAAMIELIDAFSRHTADGIANVRTAIGMRGFLDAARIVHTCIGFTATLGITIMLPTLRELERASKDGHAEDMVRCLVRWEGEFEQVLRSLRTRLDRPRAP